MLPTSPPFTIPNGWLAFELSVLRRLRFNSVLVPFTGEPRTALQLKRWGARIHANDERQSAYIKAVAYLENNREELSEAEIESVITLAGASAFTERNEEDQHNNRLHRWFTQQPVTLWFDGVYENALRLSSPVKQALALALAFKIGDYYLSFNDESSLLRQPLSDVYRRLWREAPPPIDNRQANTAHRLPPHQFIAEQHAELLFLRLPRLANIINKLDWTSHQTWHDAWLNEPTDVEARTTTNHTARFASRIGYLGWIEELLQRAAHIPQWAIVHVADNFVPTDEIIETVRKVRRVNAAYVKDFSEFTGAHGVVITA